MKIDEILFKSKLTYSIQYDHPVKQSTIFVENHRVRLHLIQELQQNMVLLNPCAQEDKKVC